VLLCVVGVVNILLFVLIEVVVGVVVCCWCCCCISCGLLTSPDFVLLFRLSLLFVSKLQI
jgi:hypothetical protein